MIYIEGKSTDPYFNLAAEEYIFKKSDEDVFMLWQNDNTIVVGKYQNTAEEISSLYVKEHGINVVRRLSGGGAVYHDLGNVNFTFIEKKKKDNVFVFRYFTKHIINILGSLGVKAEFNSRNDLVIDGKKFSGNAQYMTGDKILHHGTLLFDSDLEVLVNALNVSNVKIESKAVKSVYERVTNIKPHVDRELDLGQFKQAIRDYMLTNGCDREAELDENDIAGITELRNGKYAAWEWNYGANPRFNMKKEKKTECGLIKAYMDIRCGYINDIRLYGDFFADEKLPQTVERIKGMKYIEEDLIPVLNEISGLISGMDSKDLIELMFY